MSSIEKWVLRVEPLGTGGYRNGGGGGSVRHIGGRCDSVENEVSDLNDDLGDE